jgi:hypothetical protein
MTPAVAPATAAMPTAAAPAATVTPATAAAPATAVTPATAVAAAPTMAAAPAVTAAGALGKNAGTQRRAAAGFESCRRGGSRGGLCRGHTAEQQRAGHSSGTESTSGRAAD